MKWSLIFRSAGFVLIIIAMALSFTFCRAVPDEENNNTEGEITNWAYQLQNADTVMICKYNFSLIVIDYSGTGEESGKYSYSEIKGIKDNGTIPVAYISIGEAEDYRFYWKDEWSASPPVWLGPENPDWEGNFEVKFWEQEWKDIVFSYLDKILEQEFDGVYLDIVDAFEYWSDEEIKKDINLNEEDAANRMINFIKEISEYCRERAGAGFLIIPQNGERIIDYDKDKYYINSISGIGIEDLFYDETIRIAQSETNYRIDFIDMIMNSGKIVLSIDYVDNGSGYSGINKERIDNYYNLCIGKGYLPYAGISDRDLDELNIIPGLQPENN